METLGTPRRDKGVRRPHHQKTNTETAFLRTRRKATDAAYKARAGDDDQRADAVLENTEIWTEGHAKELRLNESTREKFKVQTLKTDQLLDEEVSPSLKQAATALDKTEMKKNARDRYNKEKRVKQGTIESTLAPRDFRDKRAFVNDDSKTDKLKQIFEESSIQVVTERVHADFHVREAGN